MTSIQHEPELLWGPAKAVMRRGQTRGLASCTKALPGGGCRVIATPITLMSFDIKLLQLLHLRDSSRFKFCLEI